MPGSKELLWEHCGSDSLPSRSALAHFNVILFIADLEGDGEGNYSYPELASLKHCPLKSSNKDDPSSCYCPLPTAGVMHQTSAIIMGAAAWCRIDIKQAETKANTKCSVWFGLGFLF